MLIITQAESLSISRERDIWGDLFNYRNRDLYSVRGRLTGNYSLESVAQIWAGMTGMVTQVTGTYIPFSINGVVVGTGKIQTLDFSASSDVRAKDYVVSFEVSKTGNLYNLTGTTYQYLNLITGIAPYLNSFSETQDFSQDNADTINFEQTVSIDLNTSFSQIDLNRYSGAYQTATGFFGSLTNAIPSFFPTDFNIFDYHVAVYTGLNPIKYRFEEFDTINNNYSFTERYNYQTGRLYIHEYNHSLSYGENGATTVSEAGFVKSSARDTASRLKYAEIGFNSVKTGIFERVSGVYSRWSGVYSTGGCNLVNFPIEKSVTRNYIAGQLDYSYTYTNDEAQRSGYTWTREHSIELQSDGFLSLTENGSLAGQQTNRTGNFPVVSGAWYGIVKPGITGRINNLYSDNISFFRSCDSSASLAISPLVFFDGLYPGGALSVYPQGAPVNISSEETFSEYRGDISYSYSFTDDPSYFLTGNFLRIKSTVSDNKPVHLVNFFNIVGFGELAQGSLQSTLGNYSNQVEIIGRSDLPVSSYVAAATGYLSQPTGVLYSLPPSYTFSPNSRNFTYQQDYIYTKYRSINDFLI